MDQNGIPYRLAAVVIIAVIALVGLFYVDRAAAVNTSPDQDILFSDDFSGDLSQWNDLIGDWSIDQEELVGSGWGGNVDAWIYAGDTSWTDYALQTKVMFGNSNAILVIRSTGHWLNEYRFDFWQQGGENGNTYQVVKYQDGVIYDFTEGLISSPVPITNPSVISIQASGNRLFLYINGVYVAEFEDSNPLPNGRIGLGVIWNYTSRFDDVMVTTLPPIMMLPPEQAAYGNAGKTVTYTVELENHTGQPDSFNLDVLPGNTWITSLITDVVGPIDDGEIVTFTVSVDVPPEAQPGDFDTASISATSFASPSDSATATVKTTATSNNFAYVTQSTYEVTIIDRELHLVVGNIDIEAMGCLGPDRLRLTPSGNSLYVFCKWSLNLIVLNIPELTLDYTISAPAGDDDIVFNVDESYAFISSPDQASIQVLDIAAQSYTTTIPLNDGGHISSLETSPTGNLIYGAGAWSGGGRIYVIDSRSFEVISMIDFGSDVWDVVISPDNQWLYASDRWGAGIAIIDVKNFAIVDIIQNTGELTGLALSLDGTSIFGGRAYYGSVDSFDIHNRSFIASTWVGGTVRDLTMDCTGEELYLGSSTNVVSVINTGTYNVDYSIPTPGKSYGVAICPQFQSNIIARKAVDRNVSHPSELVNYTITASNAFTDTIESVIFTDTLPVDLTYKEGTLSASSGLVDYQNGIITWIGSITASTTITVSFGATVSPTAAFGTSITNQVLFSAEGKTYQRSATINITPYTVYIPCASRACLPTYYDDFSNPASGWSIERDEDYSIGYANGEYFITSNPGWIVWSMRDFAVSDYRLEVYQRPAVSLDGATGIMFEINEYGFYLLEVSDGWYALWRVDAYYWDWIPLIDWTYSSDIRPGFQTNRMMVERIGNNIAVYANNKLLGSVNDGYYHGTWIGMTSSANTAFFDGRFDNFAVYTGSCVGSNTSGVLLDSLPFSNPVWAAPGSGHTRP